MEKEQTTEDFVEELNTELLEISENQWENMGWPVISIIDIETYQAYTENESVDNETAFWSEVFNLNNHYSPNFNQNRLKDTIAFVIQDQGDFNFKAITTRLDLLAEDPLHMLNYRYHGKPCENRSDGTYPEVNFWKIYDRLNIKTQKNRPVPTKEWRKLFIKRNFLHKNV